MADPKKSGTATPVKESEDTSVRPVPTHGIMSDKGVDTPPIAMSGAVGKDEGPIKNKLANRNPNRRQAGTTPRPTDKPITE
jgi:hypothetical protein